MPLGTDYARQDCSLARALEVVGERWTLADRCATASSASAASPTCRPTSTSPRRCSSARLDALVADGLLERSAGGHPEYTLTDEAQGLWPALYALTQWGEHRTTPGAPRRIFRHVGCADLAPDGRCSGCGSTPSTGRPRDPAGSRRRPDAARRPGVRGAARAAPAADSARPALRAAQPAAARTLSPSCRGVSVEPPWAAIQS